MSLWRGIVFLLLAVLGGGALPAVVQAKKPIVYVVVVDGLDGDSVDQGKLPFVSSVLAGEGGGGTYFPKSSSVLPAETNPNHTAMMTGARPGRSGIAANAFAIYGPLLDDETCATSGPLDYSAYPMPTSGESSTCLGAETIFEAVRRQGGKRRPTTSAVMGKPKLGRIFDVSYRGRRAADHIWAPCESDPGDEEYCESVPTNPVTGYAVDDATVMDEVIETANEGITVRGKTKRPDFTFVNLPQVDSAGHAFGRELPAYDVATLQADDQIERLVGVLKDRGEWERTALFVVSDHSMDTVPMKVDVAGAMTDAGISEEDFLSVQNGSVDFVYLGARRGKRGPRDRLLKRMREAVLATPGVAEALYRKPNRADGRRKHTVRRVHPEWSAGRRTGDLFVTAEPGASFYEGDPEDLVPGQHGAPQTADNTMLVMGGWNKLKTRTVSGSGKLATPQNTAIAPTVMRLLGLKPPRNNIAKPLKPAFKRSALRR